MWKFEFEAPSGTRLLRDGYAITTYGPGPSWYNAEQGKWIDDPLPGSGTHYHCKSFKAFKRHLRKHPELQGNDEVIWVSRYFGHDVVARYEVG